MTLITELQTKAAVFGLVATLAGCGSNAGNDYKPQKTKLNNCLDLITKAYNCNPQAFEDYAQKWNISVEEQQQLMLEKCSPSGHDVFANPALIACYEESSCEELNAEVCDKYSNH